MLDHISDVSGVERRVSGKIFLVYIVNDCIIPEDLNKKSFDTWVTAYQQTRRHIPEDINPHVYFNWV